MGSGSSRAFKILVPLKVRDVPHARADGGDHHEVAAHLVARREGTFRFAFVPGDPSPLPLQPPLQPPLRDVLTTVRVSMRTFYQRDVSRIVDPPLLCYTYHSGYAMCRLSSHSLLYV